jgi:hypothetical protein
LGDVILKRGQSQGQFPNTLFTLSEKLAALDRKLLTFPEKRFESADSFFMSGADGAGIEGG